MKYTKFIIPALILLIVSGLVFFAVRGYNRNNATMEELDQDRVINNTSTTKPDQDFVSQSIVSENKKVSVTGSFQSIIEVEETDVDSFVYSHRIAILDKGGSMTRILITNDEYKFLLTQVIEKEIKSGNYVTLVFENGAFVIEKARL